MATHYGYKHTVAHPTTGEVVYIRKVATRRYTHAAAYIRKDDDGNDVVSVQSLHTRADLAANSDESRRYKASSGRFVVLPVVSEEIKKNTKTRGTCPLCGWEGIVKKDGTMGKHSASHTNDPCPGSGTATPAADDADALVILRSHTIQNDSDDLGDMREELEHLDGVKLTVVEPHARHYSTDSDDRSRVVVYCNEDAAIIAQGIFQSFGATFGDLQGNLAGFPHRRFNRDNDEARCSCCGDTLPTYAGVMALHTMGKGRDDWCPGSYLAPAHHVPVRFTFVDDDNQPFAIEWAINAGVCGAYATDTKYANPRLVERLGGPHPAMLTVLVNGSQYTMEALRDVLRGFNVTDDTMANLDDAIARTAATADRIAADLAADDQDSEYCDPCEPEHCDHRECIQWRHGNQKDNANDDGTQCSTTDQIKARQAAAEAVPVVVHALGVAGELASNTHLWTCPGCWGQAIEGDCPVCGWNGGQGTFADAVDQVNERLAAVVKEAAQVPGFWGLTPGTDHPTIFGPVSVALGAVVSNVQGPHDPVHALGLLNCADAMVADCEHRLQAREDRLNATANLHLVSTDDLIAELELRGFTPGPAWDEPEDEPTPIAPRLVRFQVPHKADRRFKSWARHVIAVDTTKRNGYAFSGDWLNRGELFELPEGSIILVADEQGSQADHPITVKACRVEALGVEGDGGTLIDFTEATGRDWALQIRDQVADALND